jgi:flagellar protein FliL
MSDKDTAEKPAKKKGGKKKLFLILAGVLVVGAGGVGAGLYVGQSASAAHQEDPNRPKLVAREGVEVSDSELSGKAGKHPDPTKFQASYYPLKDSFTANLADSDGFVQAGIGVSTYYDERVLKRVETHEMAIRSAVLMTLSDQDTMTVATQEGREKLRKELKTAINGVLERKEGFGGVDDVYFTSFVVQ